MRNFILVALILHLLITIVEVNGDYDFGDIISFPRKCGRINRAYKHFAVYVGPKVNLFGQGDKDIFHRIRVPNEGKYCVFGNLNDEKEHKKENYLDGHWDKSSEKDIIKHVEAMKEHCGNYSLLTNNCEHLATYVRYGKAYLKQPGTKVKFICRMIGGKRSCPAADNAVKSMNEEAVQKISEQLRKNSDTEDQCFNKSNVAAG